MKILYYFMQYPTPMYLWQNEHIVDELAHHNIEVEIFNPLDFESLDEANEKVVQKLKDNKYDLFMTCNDDKILYVETLKKLKTLSVPMLLICFDSLMTPLRHKNVAGLFDLVMISQNDEEGFFKSYNPNTIVSHYAANPFYFQPDYSHSKINKVCFPGTPYGSRAHIINRLVHSDIPVDVYFNQRKAQSTSSTNAPADNKSFDVLKTLVKTKVGRKVIMGALIEKIKGKEELDLASDCLFLHPGVTLKETNRIFSEHDLCLSVAVGRNTGNLKNPIQIVHLRNFEIPMSGGVQFCQYFNELAECFEEDKEIIFYRTQEEMLEKAKFYLKPENENLRMTIRQNARKRAESEHTWFCRFKTAFDYLGLDIE